MSVRFSVPRCRSWGWPEVGLMILYFALRLHRLTLFPVFIDEAFHIAWARDTLALHPFGGLGDGKTLIAWAIAPLLPYQNAPFVARYAVILTGAAGLAALLALGRVLLDRRVALTGGLIYTLLPFAFFFERLALADPQAGSLGVLTAWLVVISLTTGRRRYALLAGVSLALTLLSKLPMMVYLAVPVLGWLLLTPPGNAGKRARIGTLLWIYAACAVTLVPVIVAGIHRADFGITRARSGLISTESITLPLRTWSNLRASVLALAHSYAGWPLLTLCMSGMLAAFIRRDRRWLFPALLWLLPAVEFWTLLTYMIPRYYLAGLGGLLLVGSAWGWWLLDRGRAVGGRWWTTWGIGLAALTVILIPMIGFIHVAYQNPAALPLPEQDFTDYITASSSGFGVEDGAAWLADYPVQSTVICSARINCDWLLAYLYGTPGLRFARTDILTPAWVAAEHAAGRDVLLAQDDPPHSAAFNPGSEYHLELLRRFERPGGQAALEFYRIAAGQLP